MLRCDIEEGTWLGLCSKGLARLDLVGSEACPHSSAQFDAVVPKMFLWAGQQACMQCKQSVAT
jgi:hypothetical protein